MQSSGVQSPTQRRRKRLRPPAMLFSTQKEEALITPSFPPREWYSREQVEDILAAYRTIFPSITQSLCKYWNFARHPRPGLVPGLTTNFHKADFAQLDAISKEVMAIEAQDLDVPTRGARLQALTRGEIGLSIGISPWTDHALHLTWDPKKPKIVIILGHDWYPIASEADGYAHPSDIPLAKCGLQMTDKYHYAVPKPLLAGKDAPVVLFLNLVPDWRSAGTSKTGALKDYPEYLSGFDAVVQAVLQRYEPENVSVLSWGSHTWKALWPKLNAGKGVGIKTWAKNDSSQGRLLAYLCGSVQVKFFPTAHPSFRPNFNQEHARIGYGQLERAWAS